MSPHSVKPFLPKVLHSRNLHDSQDVLVHFPTGIARARKNAAAAARPPISSVCQALRPAPVSVTRPLIAPKTASATAVTVTEISNALVTDNWPKAYGERGMIPPTM